MFSRQWTANSNFYALEVFNQHWFFLKKDERKNLQATIIDECSAFFSLILSTYSSTLHLSSLMRRKTRCSRFMLILLRLPAHTYTHIYHRTQKLHARHKHVMQALQQDQVSHGHKWGTISDDVYLARKQDHCHRSVHSGWFPQCSDQVQYTSWNSTNYHRQHTI